MDSLFRRIADKTTAAVGSPPAVIAAFALVVGWAVSGPLAEFSDTWQSFIDTATAIITFLMVFVIQNTQNRDTKAIHLKLDEIIHSMGEARNTIIDAESASDEDLSDLKDDMRDRVAREPDSVSDK